MSKKFKVGDRVRVLYSPSGRYQGAVATVVELTLAEAWQDVCQAGFAAPGEELCVLDLTPPPGGAGRVGAPHRYLAPIYDGNEKVSWSSCAWQPTSVRA